MDSPVPPQSAPIGNGPVALDRASAGRTRDAVRHVERMFRNQRPRDGRPGPTSAGWLNFAKLGGALSAATGATYTSASATLQKDTGTALADDTVTVTVQNFTDVSYDSGSIVLVGWVLGSWWVVTPDSCSHVS